MPKPKKQPVKKTSLSRNADYPRHSIASIIRIPRAILDQNGGKDCTEEESAKFVGVGYHGPYRLEISSALKFALITRPEPKKISITEIARRILRPQEPGDDTKAYREAVLQTPSIQDVYEHYRGEYLPDRKFFDNALVDKFGIPSDKLGEFFDIFMSSLEAAQLVSREGDRIKLVDVSDTISTARGEERIKNLAAGAQVASGDTCFVMMPFAPPIGDYYGKVYDPAIRKAGLIPVRADTEIFGTGKIIDQIWRGINQAKVLVAEMTSRNPNVFYELGLAHALNKPVVLVSASKDDVPFDLQHIRVIYYDKADPFWGQKLMEKLSENILSALSNPEEAVFKRALESNA